MAVVVWPDAFVRDGCQTWRSVFGPGEMLLQQNWENLHGVDYSGKSTKNASYKPMKVDASEAKHLLAYYYSAVAHSPSHLEQYLKDEHGYTYEKQSVKEGKKKQRTDSSKDAGSSS